MENKKGSKSPYKHIKKAERLEISILLNKGYTLKDISKALNRNTSSISREIYNNSVHQEYNPLKAHHKSRIRRRYARFQMMKVVKNKELWIYIEDKLKEGWSPEIISGRIKEIDKDIENISFKSIYKFANNRGLNKYLKLKEKKIKRKRKKVKQLTDRIFIDKRSKNIDNRRVYGHWEGDFIESGKKGKNSLLVLIERKTRYVLIEKITKKDAEYVNNKIKKMLEKVKYLSLTLDNDISFQKHKELEKKLSIPIYFCNPYHSWEKGSVENINGLIRKYIPKGSNISKYSKEKIKEIERKLNDKPRKCLKYKTPFEIMARKKLFED